MLYYWRNKLLQLKLFQFNLSQKKNKIAGFKMQQIWYLLLNKDYLMFCFHGF